MTKVLVGALAGALASVIVQLWFERRRESYVLMRDAMVWMTETFHHIVDLWTHDQFLGEQEKTGDGVRDAEEFLDATDRRRIRHELDRCLTPAELRARVASHFGEYCDQLKYMDKFVRAVTATLQTFIEAPAGKAPDPRTEELAGCMADLRTIFLRPARFPYARFRRLATAND